MVPQFIVVAAEGVKFHISKESNSCALRIQVIAWHAFQSANRAIRRCTIGLTREEWSYRCYVCLPWCRHSNRDKCCRAMCSSNPNTEFILIVDLASNNNYYHSRNSFHIFIFKKLQSLMYFKRYSRVNLVRYIEEVECYPN